MLEGEAGIGKTRLAEELIADARERGAALLCGRAYEEELALAYGPLVGALRERLREDPAWVEAVPERALAEAARLLPDLSAAAPPPLDGPAAQARFLDGVWETLAVAAAGTAPGILFIDDTQWADDATIGLLAYGLRRLAGRPLLVLLTWRTPPPAGLRRVVAELERSEGGVVRRLGRLSEAEVGELLTATRPGAGAELTRRLHQETEGLPFLLVEYLNTLDADPAWPLPAGARELLLGRLDAVGETARQVLAAAAVIGRSFDVGTVRAASGRSEEETVGALEELVGRGLIREGSFDYDFGHERLRALVYEETSLARRRLLHGRAADALTGPHAGGRPPPPARGPRRRGGRGLRPRRRRRPRPVRQRRGTRAPARRARARPRRTAPLHAAIGDLHTLRGDYADALASYETAAAHCPAPLLAGIEHRIGQVHHRRGERALATSHFQAALAAASAADFGARARITADLSLTAHDDDDPARAAELAEQARALAEQAGDPRALGQAHNLLGALATSAGDTAAALGHLDRSLALAQATADPGARVAALNNLALAHRARGELDRALELTTTALELCSTQGDRHREAALHNNLADLLHDAGRPEQAIEHLKRAVAIFAAVGGEGEPQPEVWKLARW